MTPNITILRDHGDMIIDGNKTAVVYHHLHPNADGIELKVFIMTPT